MLTYEDLRLLQAVCASRSGNMSRRLSFGNIVAADNIESPAGTQGQLSVEISILPASFSLQCTVSTEASVQCNVRYLQQRACRDSSVMGEHLQTERFWLVERLHRVSVCATWYVHVLRPSGTPI